MCDVFRARHLTSCSVLWPCETKCHAPHGYMCPARPHVTPSAVTLHICSPHRKACTDTRPNFPTQNNLHALLDLGTVVRTRSYQMYRFLFFCRTELFLSFCPTSHDGTRRAWKPAGPLVPKCIKLSHRCPRLRQILHHRRGRSCPCSVPPSSGHPSHTQGKNKGFVQGKRCEHHTIRSMGGWMQDLVSKGGSPWGGGQFQHRIFFV